MYCTTCGQQIPDGSTECPNCGADASPVSVIGHQPRLDSRGAVLGGQVIISPPRSTSPDVPVFGPRPRPWYRSMGCLFLAFIFFWPLWTVLILTDEDARLWTKGIAGFLLVLGGLAVLASLIAPG